MILNLIARAVGVDRITWAEILLGCCLAVVFYSFFSFSFFASNTYPQETLANGQSIRYL